MTNFPFTSTSQFRDLESINAYRELVEGGVFDEAYMMKCLNYKSRDNARTPMQWDATAYAGFSDVMPWIEVNPNYREINAQSQINNNDSVFQFYRKLIMLRKTNGIIVYGKYELLLPESEELFIYTRTYEGRILLVMCNFTGQNQKYSVPDDLALLSKELLVSNYDDSGVENSTILRPYEAKVYSVNID